MKKFIIFVFLWSFFSFSILPQAIDLSAPLTTYQGQNKMPNEVLVFPSFSQDYLRKLKTPEGHYEIWSEQAIVDWAHAQGFSVSRDHPAGGHQYKFGIVFYAPGLEFYLQTPKNLLHESASPVGWSLILDLGVLQPSNRLQKLSSDFHNYKNILRYTIFIEDIEYQTITIGYGKTITSPVQIDIPFIRNKSGKIKIEIKLANHPTNFGILYDAFLKHQEHR